MCDLPVVRCTGGGGGGGVEGRCSKGPGIGLPGLATPLGLSGGCSRRLHKASDYARRAFTKACPVLCSATARPLGTAGHTRGNGSLCTSAQNHIKQTENPIGTVKPAVPKMTVSAGGRGDRAKGGACHKMTAVVTLRKITPGTLTALRHEYGGGACARAQSSFKLHQFVRPCTIRMTTRRPCVIGWHISTIKLRKGTRLFDVWLLGIMTACMRHTYVPLALLL